MTDFLVIGVGALGGFVRAMYGLLKAVGNGKEVREGYFLMTVVISAIIGGLLGVVFDVDYRIAALAGYVGTDILENVFKGSLGKEIILNKR